jgi:hypothetical protein
MHLVQHCKGNKQVTTSKHHIQSHQIPFNKYSRQTVEFKLFKLFQPCPATHAPKADSHPKKEQQTSSSPAVIQKNVQRIQATEEKK